MSIKASNPLIARESITWSWKRIADKCHGVASSISTWIHYMELKEVQKFALNATLKT